MKGDLFMASKKQEIRKQIKKKEAKELEELGRKRQELHISFE